MPGPRLEHRGPHRAHHGRGARDRRGVRAQAGRERRARGARRARAGGARAGGGAVRAKRRLVRVRRHRQRRGRAGRAGALERFGRHRLRDRQRRRRTGGPGPLDGPRGLRDHDRREPARRLPHRPRVPAARDRAARLRAGDRVDGGRAARARACRAYCGEQGRRRGVREQPAGGGASTWAWTSAWATSASSTPTWWRAGTSIPSFGKVRRDLGPLSKRYPVSAVGDAVLAGSRGGGAGWSCRAGCARCYVLRGVTWAADRPRQPSAIVPEADREFARYVEEHGAAGPPRRSAAAAPRCATG